MPKWIYRIFVNLFLVFVFLMVHSFVRSVSLPGQERGGAEVSSLSHTFPQHLLNLYLTFLFLFVS